MKILIINTCKEKLHELEFVKPIEDILKNNNIKFETIHHKKIKKSKYDKVIICGTSLQDTEFLKHDFSWIKNETKPILGICAGIQIIGKEFGAKIKEKTEIGFFNEIFKKDFLGMKKEKQVYHLHNNYTTLPKNFETFATNGIPQAIKHKQKEIYGVLFHPEVRNEELILNFAKK